ncbi:RHS repeat-associated core domain-containing protein [Microbulbifer discodermiae]|uniref:RHS repeat-associated core domain-containing protein n=1 Tax=Microbulbifer sp. 2201CG32-9 TaxID=3232309 RepID=UPI00345B689B
MGYLARVVLLGALALAANQVLAISISGPTNDSTGSFRLTFSGNTTIQARLNRYKDGVSLGSVDMKGRTYYDATVDSTGEYEFKLTAQTTCLQWQGSFCTEPSGFEQDTHIVNVAFKPNTPPSYNFSNVTSGTTVRDGVFTFNWAAPATPPLITGYQVQEQVNGGSWTTIYKQASTSTRSISRPSSGQLADGTYRYRVRTYATVGSYTNWGFFLYSSTITVSRKPDAVDAFTQPGSGTQTTDFQVAWPAVSGQFDAVTRYELQCKLPGNSSWGDATCTKTDNSATNTGLSTSYSISLSEGSQGTYVFRARACNSQCGDWSPSKSVPVNIPLSAPAQLQFNNLPEDSEFGDYDIEWSAPTGIVTSYQLQRECKEGVETCGQEGWYDVPLANPLSQIYEARGDAEDQYRYRILACNDDACSSWTTSPWIDVHNLDGITPAATLAQATTPGGMDYSADVTQQGDAVISVPVQVAPGVNGLTPSITVRYSGARYRERNNESLPEDILGYGWRLTGFSSIRRCVKGRPNTDSIQLDNSDSLCLDGEPLVLVSGVDWQEGAKYRAMRDSFYLVELKQTNGNTWFEVSAPNGNTKEYGNTKDSRLKAGSSVHFGWSVNKVTDQFGNTMTYRYHRDTVEGINYPLEIVYGNGGDAKVQFAYGTRSDAPPQPLDDGEIEQEQLVLLHHINILLDGNLLREYRLITEPDTEEYRRLKQVQLCGYDENGIGSECLNPLEFTWQDIDGANPIDIKTGIEEVTDGLGQTTRFYHTKIQENSTDGLFFERPFGEGIVPADSTELAPVNGEFRSVVSEVQRSNGLANGWHVTRYSYQGTGLMSTNHWGFLGFYAQRAYDTESGIVTYVQFRQDFPYLGRVARIRQYEGNFDDNLQALTQQQFHYQSLIMDVGSGSTYYPYVQQSVQTLYENNQILGYQIDTTDLSKAGYGAFGELKSGEIHAREYAVNATISTAQSYWGEVATVSPTGVQRTTETAVTLNNRTSPWVIGFTSGMETSYYAGDTSQSPDRTQSIAILPYNNTGKLGTVTQFPGDPDLELAVSYAYDASGNLLSETTSGANIESRSTLAGNYIDKRYAGEITNPLGQALTLGYDPRFGKPSQVIDANNRSTVINFDPFGREVLRTNADGVTFNTSYTFCVGGTCPVFGDMIAAYKVSTSSAITPTSDRYFDILDRIVQQDTQSFDGSTVVRREYNYDTLGRLSLETEPYYSDSYKPLNIYEYDIRNRVTRIQKAGDGEIRTSFIPLPATNQIEVKVSEDVHGSDGALQETQVKSRLFNLMGDLAKTIDGEGSTEEVETAFVYDAMGLVKSVIVNNDANTESTFIYDAAGNRTSLTDPNIGTVTTVYDALNQQTSQTDNKGQTLVYQYDKLGRLLEQTDPGGVATWTYDPVGAVGNLASRSYTEAGVEGFREDYSYTAAKLVSTTTNLTVDSDSRSYQHSYGYDSNGRLERITYPSGVEAHYQYNAQGYLSAITDGTNTLKSLNTIDAFGNVEEEVYGNGVVTNRNYNPDTGRLESIATAGTSQIQDNLYHWRSNGVLESRLARVGTVKQENFSYDALNRLTSAATYLNSTLQRTLTTQYDALGNILAKTSSYAGDNSVTGYQYGQVDNAGPNAVSQTVIDGVTNDFTYDENGAVTNYKTVGPELTSITWNARQLPVRISRSNWIATSRWTWYQDEFKYGPNGQRYFRETLSQKNGTEKVERAFIIGNYEDLLPANDPEYQRIQKTRIDGNITHIAATDMTGVTVGTLEYVHRGHLGSVEKVTDESGNVILDTAFDPFGKRRAPDWTGELSETQLEELLNAQSLTTKRGFTGHEHLDGTGIIHMNGRIYDPVIGRFLSPDPIVQAPTYSQSWNRYSYVFNNPMSLTDPTGYATANKNGAKTQCTGDSCSGTSVVNGRIKNYVDHIFVEGKQTSAPGSNLNIGLILTLPGSSALGSIGTSGSSSDISSGSASSSEDEGSSEKKESGPSNFECGKDGDCITAHGNAQNILNPFKIIQKEFPQWWISEDTRDLRVGMQASADLASIPYKAVAVALDVKTAISIIDSLNQGDYGQVGVDTASLLAGRGTVTILTNLTRSPKMLQSAVGVGVDKSTNYILQQDCFSCNEK